jgi:5-methylcytosine-specific restriction enzyme subunit McrC
VGDAKYKVLKPGKWLREDLYQLLAYCSVLGLPKGILIYASEHPPETYTVRQVGIGLEIVGINMDADPSDIETQARGAAGRLFEQATEFLTHQHTLASQLAI